MNFTGITIKEFINPIIKYNRIPFVLLDKEWTNLILIMMKYN